jgi:hypothetical protein
MKVLYKVNDLGYDQCMNKKEERNKTSLELAYAKAVLKKEELHKKIDDAIENGYQVFVNVVQLKPSVPEKTSRVCQHCFNPFYINESQLKNYCSSECKKQRHLDENKNPYTKTNTSKTSRITHSLDNSWCVGAFDEVCLPQDVAAYLCLLPDEPYVCEDEEYLFDCIWHDLPQAKNADGSIYVSPKTQHRFAEHQAFITPEQSYRAYRHRMGRKEY